MDNTEITEIAKAIAQATSNNSKATTSTTNATVKRIEDGVAYVQFDGAETETPVQLTISANAGDTVKVTVSNGKAWIVGNNTAPPTDDSTAVQLFNELKAEKITADRIDTNDLFAQKIECKGTISGATLKGGTIEGTAVKAGTITGSKISAGTITGTDISGANITGSKGLFTSGFDVNVPIKKGKVEAYNLRLGTHEDKLGSYIHLGTHGSDDDADWLQYGIEIFPYADKGHTIVKGRNVYLTADRYMYLTAPGGIYFSGSVFTNNLQLDEYISDTEWRSPTIASSFTATSGNPPRARRIGKTVVFQGAVNPSKTLTGSGDKVTICTLGENYRPSQQINVLCQGSGQNKWLLTVETAGTCSFSRYGTTDKYVDATTAVWLPFHATWFVD